MKSVITFGIVLTFSILFIASSGVLKGQVFASIEEERDNSYYPDKYSKYGRESPLSAGSPGVLSGNILQGVDKEQLKEIEEKLFEGIDKDRFVNNALNLLDEYDIDLGPLNEYLSDDSWGYGGAFVLILILFILLVIIGAGFGLG